jgi:hypothetical protein
MVNFVLNYILTIFIICILLYLYYIYIGFCKDIYELQSLYPDYLSGDKLSYYETYSMFALLPYRITETHDIIKYNLIYFSVYYGLPQIPDYRAIFFPPVKE